MRALIATLCLCLSIDCAAASRLFEQRPPDLVAGPVNTAPAALGTEIEYPVRLRIRDLAADHKTLLVELPERPAFSLTAREFDPKAGFVIDDDLDVRPDPSVDDSELSYRWFGVGDDSHLDLQVRNSFVYGLLTTRGKIWTIESLGSGAVVLRRRDPSRFPLDFGGDASAQIDWTSSSRPSHLPTAKSADEVNVLVLHTPAVELAAKGGDPKADPTPVIRTRVEALFDQVNGALGRSGVFSLRVANAAQASPTGSELVPYGETNAQACPVCPAPYCPTPAECQFFGHRVWLRNHPAVQQRRDALQADLVVMLVADAVGCGVAYTQRPGCGEDSYFGAQELGCGVGPHYAAFAFSVVNWECAAATLDFAHEIGHQLGMEHDPVSTNPAAVTPSAPWSFGHFVPAEEETIMSVRAKRNGCSGCDKAPQYSNPFIPFTLHPASPSGTLERFNARTAAMLGPGVSAFRAPARDIVFRSSMEQLPCTGSGWPCH